MTSNKRCYYVLKEGFLFGPFHERTAHMIAAVAAGEVLQNVIVPPVDKEEICE
jgi:hypothetical protein